VVALPKAGSGNVGNALARVIVVAVATLVIIIVWVVEIAVTAVGVWEIALLVLYKANTLNCQVSASCHLEQG
jgi:nitrate/nitrite transporter NarK